MTGQNLTGARRIPTDQHGLRFARHHCSDVIEQASVLESEPSLPTLFLEYNKLLASTVAQLLPA